MKRVLGIFGALLIAVGILFPTNASAQNTNNFTISNYDIQYDLSRDSGGHSVLKTTETITALFPWFDQNHGLERALPIKYDGHKTELRILSVSDGELPLDFTTMTEGDVLLLRIGDANSYVHGEQTYQITYSQRDVTRYFEDTDRDEWYWDTNGTEWSVPIDKLTISVTLSDELLGLKAGNAACYKGVTGSTQQCILELGSDGGYTTSVTDLKASENVTVAFGFTKDTFVQYKPTLFEILATIWQIIFPFLSVAGFVLFIWLSVEYARRLNRTKELAITPVEYIPPRNTSVLAASQVLVPLGSAFSAQLIDLAVRHVIVIIETKPKTSLWSPAEYSIRMLQDGQSLPEEEKEILTDMFNHMPAQNEQLALKSLRNNTSYTMRTTDNDKKLKKLIEGKYGLREKSPATSKYFYRWAIVMAIVGVICLSPFVLVFAGIVAIYGVTIRPLTNKGLELRRYLLGLKRYIKASEVERLAMFQAPDTAQKVGQVVDTNNSGQMLKLYERVLPYAIVFGHQQEWSKRLGEFYQNNQTSPDWYNGSGTAAFNAAVFSSTLSSFSSTVAYSSGASSSSGGSSGGGSSGGGGGGGGGGGW